MECIRQDPYQIITLYLYLYMYIYIDKGNSIQKYLFLILKHFPHSENIIFQTSAHTHTRIHTHIHIHLNIWIFVNIWNACITIAFEYLSTRFEIKGHCRLELCRQILYILKSQEGKRFEMLLYTKKKKFKFYT